MVTCPCEDEYGPLSSRTYAGPGNRSNDVRSLRHVLETGHANALAELRDVRLLKDVVHRRAVAPLDRPMLCLAVQSLLTVGRRDLPIVGDFDGVTQHKQSVQHLLSGIRVHLSLSFQARARLVASPREGRVLASPVRYVPTGLSCDPLYGMGLVRHEEQSA